MENITKIFGELKANDSIDLKVKSGGIHAIVGENGAGKSTLMKILYGMYEADSGKIFLNDKEVTINSPAAAIKHGIGMVHQHFMLVGTLSVIENIILGSEIITGVGFLNINESKKIVNELIKSFNINVDISSKIESLPVGIQQKVEILKILYRKANILILDEPTAVLTPQETEDLFNTLRKLKAEGKTIIIITHKLGEVLQISDSVTVLRHGKVTGELETKSTSREELAKLIVGFDFKMEENKRSKEPGKTLLKIEELSVLNDKNIPAVKDVSFEIHAGEILGIAGVEGNGQTELVESIAGLRKQLKGSITINGNNNIKANIPADRHRDGIVMDFTLADNMILGRQREKQFGTALMLNQTGVHTFADNLVKEFDIRPGDYKAMISSLSGGNQQKAVVARELTKGADLIIVSHPTRGLDIKASDFVHHSILKEKEKGKAVLLVSSDLTELLKLSDRIAVMYNGEINALLDPEKTNEKEIGLYMTGGKTMSNEQ
jgi:ABC-type uncharacterized transport system ATPase subunit